jgi:predicted Zn-dependent peptidase
MAFKGTPKRPSARAISEEVDAMGGEFNAGTNKEWTNFYIKARSGVLEQAFDVLSDIVLNPLLKPGEIEREKGVIIQEINLYADNPLMKISDVFENAVYKGSRLSWDITGSQKTVRGIKREDFVNYRKEYYVPENMLVCVSGAATGALSEELAAKYFKSLKASGRKPQKPRDILLQEKPEVVVSKKDTDQTHLILGFKGKPMGDRTRYAEAVLSTILGGGMSSRLFIEVRERRGLAYSVKTFSEHVMDNGYFATYAGVKTAKVNRAISVMLEQHYKLANGKLKIGDRELTKAKEYLKGHLALSLEDTKEAGDFFALEELLLGKTKTPEEVYKAVDAVTISDVLAIAGQLFRPERLNLAIIGPFEGKEKFEKLLES